jgi:hypothetical protein
MYYFGQCYCHCHQLNMMNTACTRCNCWANRRDLLSPSQQEIAGIQSSIYVLSAKLDHLAIMMKEIENKIDLLTKT